MGLAHLGPGLCVHYSVGSGGLHPCYLLLCVDGRDEEILVSRRVPLALLGTLNPQFIEDD